MTLTRLLESWAEGLVRIAIGVGFVWIGIVEGSGYGALLDLLGGIFIVAGVAEIWFVECGVKPLPLQLILTDVHPALVTCEVPVLYATTEGQTGRIADRLAMALRGKGLGSRAIDLASSDADYIDWSHVRGVIVGASLHAHHHQKVAETFAREHAADLNGKPSAFFSVSLAAASQRPAERDAARHIADEFVVSSGWHPGAEVCFAGRLAYTKYGFVRRFIMKRIARKQAASTDTTRDHEFTNWNDVDMLAEDVARMVREERARSAA